MAKNSKSVMNVAGRYEVRIGLAVAILAHFKAICVSCAFASQTPPTVRVRVPDVLIRKKLATNWQHSEVTIEWFC